MCPALGMTTRPEVRIFRFRKIPGSRHGSSSSPVTMRVGTVRRSSSASSSYTLRPGELDPPHGEAVAKGRLGRELVVELLPALRVLVPELDPRGPCAVDVGERRHRLGQEALGRGRDVPLELGAVRRHAPVPAARDDQRQRPLRVAEAEVKRRVAAHRQPADVRPVDPERVEQAPDVLDGVILRVGAPVGRHVGRRVAASVEDDRPVAAGEEAHLEVPALGVPGELVNEDERGALRRPPRSGGGCR